MALSARSPVAAALSSLILFGCVLGCVLFGCVLMGCASKSPAVAADASPPCGQCSIWLVQCGETCVDLVESPLNCGACGAPCDSHNEICQGGACTMPNHCSALGVDPTLPPNPVDAPDGGFPPLPDGGTAPDFTQGLRGEYYGNTDLTTLQLVRLDATIDFDWSANPPDPSIALDNYSVRWLGTVVPRYSDLYTFYTQSDDGVRLWIDNQLLIDDWTPHGITEDSGAITLTANTRHDVRIEYFQGTGGAAMHWFWASPRQPREIVPASRLIPSKGQPYTCVGGSCCEAGGLSPVCCPADMRCVSNAHFVGCCPQGESCGEPPICSRG